MKVLRGRYIIERLSTVSSHGDKRTRKDHRLSRSPGRLDERVLSLEYWEALRNFTRAGGLHGNRNSI